MRGRPGGQDEQELGGATFTGGAATCTSCSPTGIRAQVDAGTVVVDDPEATGAVLLASLTYRPILDALIGHTPADVEAARFRTVWIRHALATLTRPNDAHDAECG